MFLVNCLPLFGRLGSVTLCAEEVRMSNTVSVCNAQDHTFWHVSSQTYLPRLGSLLPKRLIINENFV